MTLQAITANRLSDGLVVYLTQLGGWSERLGDALTTSDRDEAERLLGEAEAAVARQVVGPYLIDLTRDDANLRPARQREAIRAQGPTVETATAQTREAS